MAVGTLMVFDLPTHPGRMVERQQALQAVVQEMALPWVQPVAQWQVTNHEELQAQLRQLEQQGAEGLMLRHAEAPYRGGRSEDLIKLKSVDDAEAIVVGYTAGKGKYTGMVGALVLERPSGQRFRLGSGLSDALRTQPPPLGAVVSYRHHGVHPSGLPRFARFWRLRDEGASFAPPSQKESISR